MVASMQVKCTKCAATLQVPSDFGGRKCRCSKCQHVIIVPIAEVSTHVSEKTATPAVRQRDDSSTVARNRPKQGHRKQSPRHAESNPSPSTIVWLAIGGVALLGMAVAVVATLFVVFFSKEDRPIDAAIRPNRIDVEAKADVNPVLPQPKNEEKVVAKVPVAKPSPPKVYEKDARFEFLDFNAQANTGRAEGVMYPDNHLGELLLGIQVLAEVPFLIPDRYMLFGADSRFDGIGVSGKFVHLHVLHGTHFYGGNGEQIAHFTIRYTDGSTASLPVCYRRDVVNYWTSDGAPTHAKVAWRGSNRAAASQGCNLALFLSTYANPHPEKNVDTIDYCRDNQGQVRAFCVALTVARE